MTNSTYTKLGNSIAGEAIAFFIPLLMFIEVELIGRLFLPEILLLCMLPFLLLDRWQLLLAPLPKQFLLLGFAWLLSQILTDVIRGTPFVDWSRGWAKIIFLLLDFAAVYLYLNGKEARFMLFLLGLALSQTLVYFLNPNLYAEDYPWKFGFGSTITLIGVLASQLGFIARKKWLSPAIVVSMGALNFYMGSRGAGVICFLAGLFVAAQQWNRASLKRIRLGTFAALVASAAAAIYGVAGLYGYGASEGWFGEDAREKYEMQSSGDTGILMGGRSEWFASTEAVIESPIIGHGSWAKDPKYVDLMVEIRRERGYRIEGEYESDLIPSHSHLMGAWVEAGIVGALFWSWALLIAARGLMAAYGINLALVPLIAVLAFGLLWNILFSPFGADGRIYAAYELSLMMLALTSSRSSLANKTLA